MLTLLRIVYFIGEHGITYVMLSAIWYHEKREKKIRAGVLLLRSLFTGVLHCESGTKSRKASDICFFY